LKATTIFGSLLVMFLSGQARSQSFFSACDSVRQASAVEFTDDWKRESRHEFGVTFDGQLVDRVSFEGGVQCVEVSRWLGSPVLSEAWAQPSQNGLINVLALSYLGELEQFQWTKESGWQRHDISNNAKGPPLNHLLNIYYLADGSFHVLGIARGSQWQRLEYVWSMQSGWFYRFL
jgi:hypothetical protein